MDSIITRFPPSPTGYLHVGGARTALFNWLYARHHQGRFVLRIEDTDTQRSTQASVDAIFEALEWLGIDWDEGPYYQSQRLALYREYIDKLLDSGHAYWCTCTPEAVEAMRRQAMAQGANPKYDGTCREKGLKQIPGAVVRFKAPQVGTTVLADKVKGNIVFPNTELDDFVICRSDGMPTYNLAVVVDDMTMNINTIIRGDDHVSNTPKQIQLYRALNHPLPAFAHVPMVLGNDRTRLSKRHGAMSVTAYRDMGYLPQAMLNYLVRLGWSSGDQEFFTREALIEKFNLENIGRSAGIFDLDKLLALNYDHIKQTALPEICQRVAPFLAQRQVDVTDARYLARVVETLQNRSKTLVEMADAALFYYQDVVYDQKAAAKLLNPSALEPLKLLFEAIDSLPTFEAPVLESAFVQVMEKTGLKLGKIAQPVRLALTGKTASPGIFEVISVLGRAEVMARLSAAIHFIEQRA
jgi:glutamyl-tRNA synthetase